MIKNSANRWWLLLLQRLTIPVKDPGSFCSAILSMLALIVIPVTSWSYNACYSSRHHVLIHIRKKWEDFSSYLIGQTWITCLLLDQSMKKGNDWFRPDVIYSLGWTDNCLPWDQEISVYYLDQGSVVREEVAAEVGVIGWMFCPLKIRMLKPNLKYDGIWKLDI